VAELLQFSLIAFTSIFVLVDPFAAIPTFLVMTADSARMRRCHMAMRAAWTCCIVLVVFGIAGRFIFNLFGITLPAFKIAGGIILGLIGLDMVQARRSPTKETPGDTEESLEKEDVGIIPLGIPMLAGPGSISTVMVLVSQSSDWLLNGLKDIGVVR
jgi:multiple antibiotic resistance protein